MPLNLFYTMVQKVKNDQKLKSRGGPALSWKIEVNRFHRHEVRNTSAKYRRCSKPVLYYASIALILYQKQTNKQKTRRQPYFIVFLSKAEKSCVRDQEGLLSRSFDVSRLKQKKKNGAHQEKTLITLLRGITTL